MERGEENGDLRNQGTGCNCRLLGSLLACYLLREGMMRARPLVVVGGGPAGMAAAIEAARAGVSCTLIDEAPRLGGQVTDSSRASSMSVSLSPSERTSREGSACARSLVRSKAASRCSPARQSWGSGTAARFSMHPKGDAIGSSPSG